MTPNISTTTIPPPPFVLVFTINTLEFEGFLFGYQIGFIDQYIYFTGIYINHSDEQECTSMVALSYYESSSK